MTQLERCETDNLLVSVSGGRTSMWMAKRLKETVGWKEKNKIFVFSNTGKEAEATLDFVKRCDEEFELGVVWIEPVIDERIGYGTRHKIVSFETAARKGEPFEDYIKKYGIPNMAFPSCTRDLKLNPIKSYTRTVFGTEYDTALGIRIDEASRIKQHSRIVYPMVDFWTSVKEVREFWNNQSFDLGLKDYEGNCDLCWKKSLRKKLTLIKENPDMVD